MMEESWDSVPDDEDVSCDTCKAKYGCRCDSDYEQWKESQLDDRD